MNKKNTLNILFTSDIHGYLLPIDYASNSKSDNGLSLLASKMKEYDKANTITIDLGDAIQGSPMMYFHQLNKLKYPNPVSDVFNYLHYDYFIPGNHDFNYGKSYLKDFIRQLDAKTLCQNIYINHKLLFNYGYDIKEFDSGIKVLIVGLTTKYIPNWENPRNIKDYKFNDPVDEAKRIVNIFRNQVDLVILAYHGGFEKDILTGEEFVRDTGENQGYRLFNEVEGVDILLTGHQHRRVCENINGKVAMQPSGNASALGVIEVEFNQDKSSFSFNPYFVEASSLKEDTSIPNIIANIEQDTQKFLDEVIGIVPEDNLIIKDSFLARKEKHPIVSFINTIQMDATKAMLSSTSLANQVTGFEKEITVRNVLTTYVYSNTLVVIEINGERLKEYLEKSAEYFIVEDGEITYNPRFSYPKLQHYNYDMIDGMNYTFDLRREFGDRVVKMTYRGEAIKPEDKFTMVLNNYRASGGGDFEMLKDLPIIKEVPLDVAELMIDYIRRHKYLHIHTRNNITLLI